MRIRARLITAFSRSLGKAVNLDLESETMMTLRNLAMRMVSIVIPKMDAGACVESFCCAPRRKTNCSPTQCVVRTTQCR
jgi:hypothetical protein